MSLVRRPLEIALALAIACGALLGRPGVARAEKNDLALLNLCDMSAGRGCPWVAQTATSTTVTLDADAASRFRSLMSELGMVVAPRLQTPADTLGFAGFQVSLELGLTQISRDKSFWNGIEGVSPQNPLAVRPDGYLTTVGAFLRKGMWFPAPAFEWGVGAMNLLQSQMWAIQGYAKIALQEGFHGLPLPSAAVRGSFSQLVGTDQVTLTVAGIDAMISKAFGIAGTVRVEPFVDWNYLWIDARSGVIDATPGCDAVALHDTNPADAAAVRMLPTACPAAQAGTWADLSANFTFPDQDVITRQRFSAGFKAKLAMMFLVAQYAYAPKGGSRDQRSPSSGGRDDSGAQRAFSLSGGFDF